jgi:vancomycin resistance protein YoaR
VLNPDEEFSFNEVVGPRTSARGFLPAGVFIGGRLEEGIGGGICQTSSTLYSAIMDSELYITERYPHGRAIPYLPRGRDATVFWNVLDFKFENNTDYPLRIDFDLDDRSLTARVYGTIIEDYAK